METETKAGAVELTPPDPFNAREDDALTRLRVRLNGHHSTEVHLTADQLQAIVQQAYDQHGMVAQLWTDGAKS